MKPWLELVAEAEAKVAAERENTPAAVLLRILCHEHADIPYDLRAEAGLALAAWNEAERKDNA